MQDSLTLLYDLILGLGSAYVGTGFVLGVIDLWKKCSPDYVCDTTEAAVETEQRPQPLELPASSTAQMDAIALPTLESKTPELELELELELEPIDLADDQTTSY